MKKDDKPLFKDNLVRNITINITLNFNSNI